MLGTIASRAARASRPSSLRSRWNIPLSARGIVSTTWRCGTGSRISVTTCSANNAERFAWRLGQKLRVLQEKASRCSARQFGQRIRAKPPSSRPQAR